jgi:hypothetical protein
MSDARESTVPWSYAPDNLVLPIAYRGSRQAERLTVQIQAPSGSWFPLLESPHFRSWATDNDGLENLVFAIACNRRYWFVAAYIVVELKRLLEPLLLCADGWQLTVEELERMLAQAELEADAEAELDEVRSGRRKA